MSSFGGTTRKHLAPSSAERHHRAIIFVVSRPTASESACSAQKNPHLRGTFSPAACCEFGTILEVPMKVLIAVLLALSAMVASSDAQTTGRYSMSPAEGGGVIRLDTETGAMSLCDNKGADWQCRPINEQRSALAEENKQLREEIAKLRTDLKELEGLVIPKSPSPQDGDRPQFQLPSEEDVDKALTYIQRLFRKFNDKLDELERETSKPPPGPQTPL